MEKGGKIPRDFFNGETVLDEPNRKKVGKDGSKEQKKLSKRRKADHMGEEPIKEMKADKSESKTTEELDEDKLFIYKNNFVRGVIDKAQFGDYGLIHTVHELYGPNTAGVLLSVLSRLFTVFLQVRHIFILLSVTKIQITPLGNASLINHLDNVYDSDAWVHLWSR